MGFAMFNLIKTTGKMAVALLWCCSVQLGLSGAAAAEDFLPVDKAFALSAAAEGRDKLRIHWQIAPGYHLYRDRIHARVGSREISADALTLPPGKKVFDTNFSKEMDVYESSVDVIVNVPTDGGARRLELSWQGCADAGLCYAPETTSLDLVPSTQGANTWLVKVVEASVLPDVSNTGSELSPPIKATAPSPATVPGSSEIERTLASGSWLRVAGLFWLAGLLLAFTPCVLPMVPILSSLIAGRGEQLSRAKGFGLSAAYSIGMALVYAGFGVAAGLAGEGLAAALQNPWVLGGFALLLSGMALSMFGVYELQMPSFIQGRAAEWSNRFQGGSFLGVFLMGGVSALVVGPCVAAPLAGALVFISQTRDVVLGGIALFSMAMGMSVPLLLVGVSAGSLLPRAGAWMERVKQVFGMMLFAVAIWMVSPVLAPAMHMVLWATWFLAVGALMGVFGPASSQQGRTPVAARAGGAAAVTVALLLLVGASSGGQSVIQPLAHLRGASAAVSGTPSNASTGNAPHFARVSNLAQLEAEIAEARGKGQTVMLDFYADWCVACKEFEAFTFSDPSVQNRLRNFRLLQADVTANNSDDKALMKRFGLFGPPGVLFFDRSSGLDPVHKVIGFQNAAEFSGSLDLIPTVAR